MKSGRPPMPPGLTLTDVIGWDVVTWSLGLQFWLDRSRIDLDGARVLDVGAGFGGLSLYFAARGATVVCTNVDDPDRPRSLHDGRAHRGRITYERLDVTRWT